MTERTPLTCPEVEQQLQGLGFWLDEKTHLNDGDEFWRIEMSGYMRYIRIFINESGEHRMSWNLFQPHGPILEGLRIISKWHISTRNDGKTWYMPGCLYTQEEVKELWDGLHGRKWS